MSENLIIQSNGLSNSKLELATATEEDVLTGKTFYAGNKELKIGNYNGLRLNRSNIKSFSSSHSEGHNFSITVSIPFSEYKIIYLDIVIYNYSASQSSTGTCILKIENETILNTRYTRPGGPTRQEWKVNMNDLQDKWRSGNIICTISGNTDNDACSISGFCVGKI